MWFFKHYSLVFAFSILLVIFDSSLSFACSSNGCAGCRLDHIRQNQSWMNFYNTLTAKGVEPISCYRTYQCQVNLAKTCGGGRAAKPGTSNHEVGIAMDFSTRNGNHRVAKSLAPKIIKGPVRGLPHGGGGYHMSNSTREGSAISYTPSAESQRAINDYTANRSINSAPISSKCGTGSRLIYRNGFQGKWLQRRSCKWVRMTWN